VRKTAIFGRSRTGTRGRAATTRAKRGYRAVAAASALLSAAALALVAQAPASAASVTPAHATATAHRSVKPGGATKHRALPRVTGLGKGNDYKRVCGTPKAGHATCMALLRTNVAARKGLRPDTALPPGYGPADLQSAYNLPSSTSGNGETVAVVDAYDNPNAEADLGVYRAQYGLPPCTTANGCFEKVNQEGQQSNYPTADAGWAEEESLDVDMVSAVCPNCHILLVEANSNSITDLGASEDEAVTLGAQYISNSYNTDQESSSELQWDAYYNHPGVVVTASAGDDGYDSDGLANIGFPAASQYVTSVGGTTLTEDPSVSRGWTETAWGTPLKGTLEDGTGSGCSAYETKPAWQKDIGCSNRTDNDVSADADPDTGVAVYDTYGGDPGWEVFGGTSVSSPLIASVYALAGAPAAGTYPASYPYADPSALNDVTSGSNSPDGCYPTYLCTAGPGYDGPTGLGTPNGVAAFTAGPHGTISGQATNAATGQPISGVEVTAASGASAVTNADGDYNLAVLAGSYNVTAADYGYGSQTTSSVTVTAGATTTENFTLNKLPTATVSGTVTDGSGQGWPLYASISINGVPGAPVYTNPYTGAYSVTLPQNASYTMTVTPVEPGYQATTQQVSVGATSLTQNIAVPVDTSACEAPGYQPTGNTETFTGWTGTTPQDGWSIVDKEGNGETWNFSNPGSISSPPGGDSDFASVDSAYYGKDNSQNTSLVSPVENLSGDTSPVITFDDWLYGIAAYGVAGEVDLSLDGGQTWTTVWDPTSQPLSNPITISIPQAAGQSDVQVRFHYTSGDKGGGYWAIDNIFIGNACTPIPGGMVAGVVNDGNTGQPVNGGLVSEGSALSNSGITTAEPGDPNVPGGFFEFFSSLTGSQKISASETRYRTQSKTVNVAADGVTQVNFTLQAGRLKVTPGLSGTVKMGDSVIKRFTISNTGKVAAQVSVGAQTGGFTSAAQRMELRNSAPLRLIKGHYTLLAGLARHAKSKSAAAPSGTTAGAVNTSWSQVPSYSSESIYNVAAYNSENGKLYSIGGYNSTGYTEGSSEVYDPTAQAWSPIAPIPFDVAGASAAFLDGKLYVYGGFAYDCFLFCLGGEENTQIYNPATNSWSMGVGLPENQSHAFSAVATLDGQMYVIGGCFGVDVSAIECSGQASDRSYRYDPASNSWTAVASYPVLADELACGGVAGELVCTGGVNPQTGQTYSATYIYNPATNAWSQGASLPVDLWGMGYSAANGQLLVSDGVTGDSTEVTNQGFAYTPATNSWSALPNSIEPRWRGGSACGFFQIGGSQQIGVYSPAGNEELSGYDGCGTDGTQVPWLSESPAQVTVPAHGSVTVAVTLNGGSAAITQPGAYTADLEFTTDTPYGTSPVGVTMNVTPPKTWGKVTGTVSGTACDGTTSPLAGATVQVDSKGGDYTLSTDTGGQYSLWLDKDSNPLTLLVADDGWRTQTKKVRITAGQTTTANFTLTPQGACS